MVAQRASTQGPRPHSQRPAHLVGNQGQPHAFQMPALLAEDEMTLFRLGDDEIELDFFSQHRRRERECVKGRIRHLDLQRREGGQYGFPNIQAILLDF